MSALRSWQGSRFEEGLALFDNGDPASAEVVLSNHLDECPTDHEARHVLALCQRQLGRLDESLTNLTEVVRASPQSSTAHSNAGAVSRELGRLGDAEVLLRKAVELGAANHNAWNNLGTVLNDLQRLDEARECFEQALRLEPGGAEAHCNLSRVKFETGDIGGSAQSARLSVALDSNLAEAHNRIALVSGAAGDVETSVLASRRATSVAPDRDLYASNHILRAHSSDSHSAEDLKRLAVQWGQKYSDVPPLVKRGCKGIRRIGLVSGDLRNHPVGHFLKPLLPALSEHAELFAYSTSQASDELTGTLRQSFAGWRSFHLDPSLRIAEQIFADEIDVLIDLAGHTRDGRLDVFAQRPAPIQVSWLGYSGTTGLPQMDYLLADPILVPDHHECNYSEKVLRLPGAFLCCDAPRKVERCGSKIADFGVFNNPTKYSEACYAAWARILEASPGATLLLKYHNLHDRWVQSQIRRKFEGLGIDPERVCFRSTLSYNEHLETVASVRVALDTFPYSGATTTLDCLTAGTPLVTLVGDRYCSRMSASLLNAIGRTEGVSASPDGYVATALRLNEDFGRYQTHQGGLAEALSNSRLCDPQDFARGFWHVLQQTLV